MNLGKILSRSARFWPHNEAVVDSRQRLTYAQLEARSNRLASGLLKLGLEPGAHVAILAMNRVELVEAEVAFYKAAMVKVPINARLSPDEIVRVLNDSRSVAVITGSAPAKALAANRAALPYLKWIIVLADEGGDIPYRELLDMGDEQTINSDPADDQLAVLHYTSGSSGVLKAAMLTSAIARPWCAKASPAPYAEPAPTMSWPMSARSPMPAACKSCLCWR